MANISIALDLLPAIKNLEKMEKEIHKFLGSLKQLKNAKPKKTLKGNWGITNASIQIVEAQAKEFWESYQAEMAKVESHVSYVAETLFASVVARTKKHTNRAAGSWAISWNTESENSDIGFLHPDGAPSITYYSGKRDWYPEAPTTEHGTKILGVHDWAWIQARHEDMVNNVIHEFSFSREWGKRDDRGRMMAQKTIFIYNSCPYIQELTDGSLSDSEISAGAVTALSITEAQNMLKSGTLQKSSGYKKKYLAGV